TEGKSGDERTFTRKALEIVKAYMMNRTYSKEETIQAYLNIVFFGRQAYGIEAAANAYFGKHVNELKPEEAAVIAGMIQNPSRSEDEAYRLKRWNYVMDEMVQNGWYPREARAT